MVMRGFAVQRQMSQWLHGRYSTALEAIRDNGDWTCAHAVFSNHFACVDEASDTHYAVLPTCAEDVQHRRQSVGQLALL